MPAYWGPGATVLSHICISFIFPGPLSRKYDLFWSFKEAKSNLPSRTILYLFLTSCHTVSSLDNSFVAGLSFLGLKIHHSTLLQPRIVSYRSNFNLDVQGFDLAFRFKFSRVSSTLLHQAWPEAGNKSTAAVTVFHDPQWWEAPLFLPI